MLYIHDWINKKNSFSRTGTKIWNSIPLHLRKLPKFSFKKTLHTKLLQILSAEDNYVELSIIISVRTELATKRTSRMRRKGHWEFCDKDFKRGIGRALKFQLGLDVLQDFVLFHQYIAANSQLHVVNNVRTMLLSFLSKKDFTFLVKHKI